MYLMWTARKPQGPEALPACNFETSNFKSSSVISFIPSFSIISSRLFSGILNCYASGWYLLNVY
jgi:hypothetical protein